MKLLTRFHVGLSFLGRTTIRGPSGFSLIPVRADLQKEITWPVIRPASPEGPG